MSFISPRTVGQLGCHWSDLLENWFCSIFFRKCVEKIQIWLKSYKNNGYFTGIHVPFTNCFVCRWFCVVHDPKPPLHSRNWLSFGKFQDTQRFLIHCERHFSSWLPPSGGTWKYAKAPSTNKTWKDSLLIDMLLSAVSVLVGAQSSSEIPEGLTNNPVYYLKWERLSYEINSTL